MVCPGILFIYLFIFVHIKSLWIVKFAPNKLCVWCFVASFNQCDVVASILILILRRIMNSITNRLQNYQPKLQKNQNSKYSL